MQTSLGDTGRARGGGQPCLITPSPAPTSAQRHSKQCPRRLNLFLLLAEESSCQARSLNISISSAIIFSFQNRHGPIIFFCDCFPLCLKLKKCDTEMGRKRVNPGYLRAVFLVRRPAKLLDSTYIHEARECLVIFIYTDLLFCRG